MYISLHQDVHVRPGKKVKWTIATARQNFPTLVGLAAREPQDIYRRDKLVARVVSPDALAGATGVKPSAAELLAEIQRVCVEEDYDFQVAPRVDRPNPFLAVLEEQARTTKKRRRARRK